MRERGRGEMRERGRGEMRERVWGSRRIEPLPPYRRRVRARTPDEDGALGVDIKSVKQSDVVQIIGPLPSHANARPSEAKTRDATPRDSRKRTPKIRAQSIAHGGAPHGMPQISQSCTINRSRWAVHPGLVRSHLFSVAFGRIRFSRSPVREAERHREGTETVDAQPHQHIVRRKLMQPLESAHQRKYARGERPLSRGLQSVCWQRVGALAGRWQRVGVVAAGPGTQRVWVAASLGGSGSWHAAGMGGSVGVRPTRRSGRTCASTAARECVAGDWGPDQAPPM